MSELLKKDTTIKILSILFAVILWFVVNPVTTKPLSVPLTIRGEETLKDKNISLKNKDYNRTIDIIIRGNEDKIKNINGYDFEAVLDFSKINSADEKYLNIEGPKYIGKEDGIIIQKVLQDSIAISLEKLEKNSYPVEVRQTGSPRQGYKIIGLTPIPDSIALQGTDSLIQSVDEIRTNINVNNIDRDTVIKKQACKVYDKEGKELAELSRNLTVDVKVQVAKEVPVTPVIKGKPSGDYTEGVSTVVPETVLITGRYDILAKITELKTEPVNIENASKNVEKVSLISLPQGVKLFDTPREVTVSVVIEPLAEKKLVVLKDNISLINVDLPDVLTYEMKTESVEVGLKGPKLKLNSINSTDLRVSVDVGGLGEGLHRVPLIFSSPQDTKIDKDYYVEIKIQKILPAEP